jgi:predicted nucleic acid-binding protein
MYLVDTSVWVNYLRGQHTKASEHFMQLLDEKHSFGISPIIYQEILQGAATQKDFNKLNEYLFTQRFFHPADPLQFHYQAAHILFACRAKGFTIRSTIDCLIAQTAIEHELILLHDDKDFEHIHQVFPKLQIYPRKSKKTRLD